jgi:hypothetical protein
MKKAEKFTIVNIISVSSFLFVSGILGYIILLGLKSDIKESSKSLYKKMVRREYLFLSDAVSIFKNKNYPSNSLNSFSETFQNCAEKCDFGCDFATYDHLNSLCDLKYIDKTIKKGLGFQNNSFYHTGELRNTTLIISSKVSDIGECKTLCSNNANCDLFQYQEIENSSSLECFLQKFHTEINFSLVFRNKVNNNNEKEIGSLEIIGSTGIVCVHAILLINGKIMCSSRPEYYKGHPNYEAILRPNLVPYGELATIFDPLTREFYPIAVDDNLFCNGAILLSDGNVFFSGGDNLHDFHSDMNLSYNRNPSVPLTNGLRKQRIFNLRSNSWIYLHDLVLPRWYPSVIRTEFGKIFSFGGSQDGIEPFRMQKNGEIYSNEKNINILFKSTLLEDVESSFYPYVFIIPGSGDIFVFSVNKWGVYDKETGEEKKREKNDIVSGFRGGDFPTAGCLLPLKEDNNYLAEFILFGGSDGLKALDSVAKLVLKENDKMQWTYDSDNMPYGRLVSYAVLQPNGKVLIVGGARLGKTGGLVGKPNLRAAANDIFCYDPYAAKGKKFSIFAHVSIQRLYHSSALFIPDGRTLLLGCDQVTFDPASAYEHRVEAFTPPWLLNGNERPEIISGPSKVKYGEVFKLKFRGSVGDVTLMTPGSATHGVDFTQRLVFLKIHKVEDSNLYVRAPPNSSIILQGYHMIFLLNMDTPSEAFWIKVE